MSQISFLSDQYKQIASTSDKINNSVITLKKKHLIDERLEDYLLLKVSDEDLQKAYHILLPFLESVDNAITGNIQESSFLPLLIFEDYKTKLSSNQYLKDDIKELIERIRSKHQLETRNINTLDEMLGFLDTERSTLFRKLRKARG
jgi:hypothetical protein